MFEELTSKSFNGELSGVQVCRHPVNELITAFGRHTLRQMRDIASNFGYTVVAGDTDSLFLDGDEGSDGSGIHQFIAECKKKIE
jgi:DNA polymerase elongation subunit (family B)